MLDGAPDIVLHWVDVGTVQWPHNWGNKCWRCFLQTSGSVACAWCAAKLSRCKTKNVSDTSSIIDSSCLMAGGRCVVPSVIFTRKKMYRRWTRWNNVHLIVFVRLHQLDGMLQSNSPILCGWLLRADRFLKHYVCPRYTTMMRTRMTTNNGKLSNKWVNLS
jgi:hypothetical protein